MEIFFHDLVLVAVSLFYQAANSLFQLQDMVWASIHMQQMLHELLKQVPAR